MFGAGEQKPRILLVEDEALIRLAVLDALEDCGFEVAIALNAGDALKQIEHADFDLVFTDIQMPGKINGLGLASWLRINRPGLPVFLATGNVGMANTAHEICEKHHRMFTKPYDIVALAKMMGEAIRTRAPGPVFRPSVPELGS